MTRPIPGSRYLRPLERCIHRVLSAFGFEITRLDGQRVRYKNFVSLCEAYEQRLAEAGESLAANATRPRLLARLMGTPPGEAYFIIRALAQAGVVEGDVCEFGVAQGETSALIANEVVAGDKTLHLFDSFEGLPAPAEQDELKDDVFSRGSMVAYAGVMNCPEDMVRARLETISFPADRYVIHKGFIETVLRHDGALPQAVSFAYVDLDFYEPTKAVLGFLDGVVSKGATIIVDDYDFFSTGAKTAVDEFVAARREAGRVYQCDVPDERFGHFAVLRRRDG